MTAVQFTRVGLRYVVRFVYSPDIVAAIKNTVPAFARSFDPITKIWMVDCEWATVLAAQLRYLGYAIVGLDDQRPSASHATDSADWARAVFTRVGRNRAPQAYKLLSRVCHPDHGGDHQLQLELNAAFAEIERKSA